jgi:hypothetical protein
LRLHSFCLEGETLSVGLLRFGVISEVNVDVFGCGYGTEGFNGAEGGGLGSFGNDFAEMVGIALELRLIILHKLFIRIICFYLKGSAK